MLKIALLFIRSRNRIHWSRNLLWGIICTYSNTVTILIFISSRMRNRNSMSLMSLFDFRVVSGWAGTDG